MESRIGVGFGAALAIGITTQNMVAGIGAGIFIALLPSLLIRKNFKKIKL